MSHTQSAAQDGSPTRRVNDENQIEGPHGAPETEDTDSGRRWYHPRPEPRRRTDLLGLNSVLAFVFPFPWWGW